MGRRGDSSAAGVGRQLGVDEVVDHFTLIGDEVDQLHNMSGATRLGFAVLLKFCGIRRPWHSRIEKVSLETESGPAPPPTPPEAA